MTKTPVEYYDKIAFDFYTLIKKVQLIELAAQYLLIFLFILENKATKHNMRCYTFVKIFQIRLNKHNNNNYLFIINSKKIMRKIFFFTAVFLFSFPLFLQAQTTQKVVVFDYDATGNRIYRYMDQTTAPPLPTMPNGDTTQTAPQDTSAATFRIITYPNPVQTTLTIDIEVIDDSPYLPTTFNVQIVSLLGLLVHQQTYSTLSPIQVNMSRYMIGWYQLIVTRGSEIHQVTILKQ